MSLARRGLAVVLSALLAAPVSAATAVPAAAPPAGLALIGVAAAVRGSVRAQAPGQAVGRVLGSGLPLYLNEHIVTGPDGRLQVLLLDQTTFTVGPDSDMVLDKFVYDPSTNAGKLSARLIKGVFRFVTGKIAKHRPDDVSIRMPTGTIGIRGTMVAARVDPVRADVALLGPGPANNAHESAGGITASNHLGSVRIDRGGFFTRVSAVAPPSVPMPITAQAIQAWISKVDARTPAAGSGPAAGSSENGADHADKSAPSQNGSDHSGKSSDEGRNMPRNGSQQASAPNAGPGPAYGGSARTNGPSGPGAEPGSSGPNGQPAAIGVPPAMAGGQSGVVPISNASWAEGRGPNGYPAPIPGGLLSGSATEVSGQALASGSLDASLVSSQINTVPVQFINQATQDLTNTATLSDASVAGITDNEATWEQVLGITAGTGKYTGSGTYICSGGVCGGTNATSPATGDFTFGVSIDFARRIIGGSGSSLTLSGPISDSTVIGAVSYAGQSGTAAVDNSAAGFNPSNPNFTHVGIVLRNDVGSTATSAVVGFQYQNPGGASAIGSARATLVTP